MCFSVMSPISKHGGNIPQLILNKIMLQCQKFKIFFINQYHLLLRKHLVTQARQVCLLRHQSKENDNVDTGTVIYDRVVSNDSDMLDYASV
jgi:hypothetical protein